jgi:xylulokinase
MDAFLRISIAASLRPELKRSGGAAPMPETALCAGIFSLDPSASQEYLGQKFIESSGGVEKRRSSMLSLGFDIGSSSIKGAVLDVTTGATVASSQYPREEMAIQSPQPGWAEQDPEYWWNCIREVTRDLLSSGQASAEQIGSIGLSYQMHGLVVTDREGTPLRPAIIWCDSRAVEIGDRAFAALGEEYCLTHCLNSPGNFTASKLRWVRENQPDLYRRVAHIFLPGDYIAFRMTGEATTTVTGLSEGIFWDFQSASPARRVLEVYQIDETLLPRIVPAIGIQGELTPTAAGTLGLRAGTPVSYRAGDQPNNAFSLNVLEPGEVAATAGTSGVVYGVTDSTASDPHSRVNLFAHVNYTEARPRLGILLCINGTGILFSWLRRMMGSGASYADLNALAAQAPVGAEGVSILPFGNGAERMLENRTPGGWILGLDFVRHSQSHLVRAAQEGIAFAFRSGMAIMQSMGMNTDVIRAGHANLFLSPVFRETLANVTGARIEMYDTDGAVGAARGAAVGVGAYPSVGDAFRSLRQIAVVEPDGRLAGETQEAYERWEQRLETAVGTRG